MPSQISALPPPDVKPPVSGPNREEDTVGTIEASALWDEDGFGFDDLLDIVNPLQHIPLISTIYRELTGDEIGYAPRVLGGALFGGAIGAVAAVVNVMIKETSGRDLGEHAIAMFDDGETATDATEFAEAREIDGLPWLDPSADELVAGADIAGLPWLENAGAETGGVSAELASLAPAAGGGQSAVGPNRPWLNDPSRPAGIREPIARPAPAEIQTARAPAPVTAMTPTITPANASPTPPPASPAAAALPPVAAVPTVPVESAALRSDSAASAEASPADQAASAPNSPAQHSSVRAPIAEDDSLPWPWLADIDAAPSDKSVRGMPWLGGEELVTRSNPALTAERLAPLASPIAAQVIGDGAAATPAPVPAAESAREPGSWVSEAMMNGLAKYDTMARDRAAGDASQRPGI